MPKILFVCLGNICRSPAAEAIFNHKSQGSKGPHPWLADSAGILDYHQGEPADPRMTAALKAAGYQSLGHSRPVQKQDFTDFDLIVAMDSSNMKDLERKKPYPCHAKLVMMCDYARHHQDKEVPDPYYGGEEGFRYVISLLEDAIDGLLTSSELSHTNQA